MSKKEQLTLAFPLPDDCAAAAQSDGNDPGGERCSQHTVAILKEGSETPLAPARANPIPRSHRELGVAIFAQCDPVAFGCDLLGDKDDRGAATKLRALETFADWAYGKATLGTTPSPTRVIWDLPLRGDGGSNPEPAKLEGGEK